MIIRCNSHKSTEEILSDRRSINPYSNTGIYFSLSIRSEVNDVDDDDDDDNDDDDD